MGDLIGARQSGGFEVRHARLPADDDLLARARQLAIDLIGADPALQRAENQPLRERAVARYPRAVELFRVGCRTSIRTPTPVAWRRLRTSGSNGMLSGFGAWRVSSQTNIAAAPTSAVSPPNSQRRACPS